MNRGPQARSLDADRLAALLGTGSFVTRLIVPSRVDSTNEELRRQAAGGAGEGTVVVADRQTAGRGRRGRAWHSTPGLGLCLSVLLRPGGEVREATRWTVAAALAACETCREQGCEAAVVKWPNDVMFGGRKLGGILAELRSAGGRPLDLVVGIGLNVNQRETDFPPELRHSATSLRLAAGRGILELEPVAAGLLRGLERIATRLKRGAWEAVAADWERLAPAARGRRVRVAQGSRPAGRARAFEGLTRGLGDDGALLVERSDGRVVPVRLAETVTVLE